MSKDRIEPEGTRVLMVSSGTMPSFFVEANKDLSHLVLAGTLEQLGWRRLVGNTRSRKQDKGTRVRRGSGWTVVHSVGPEQIPKFIWAVSEASVDWHAISDEQIVNHFPCVGALTTKAGLCATLRDLHW